MKPEQVWQAALGELQLQMTKATFDTWVKDSRVVGYEDGTYIIGVRSAFAKDWLENRLQGTIRRTLEGIAQRSVEVRYMVYTSPLEEINDTPARYTPSTPDQESDEELEDGGTEESVEPAFGGTFQDPADSAANEPANRLHPRYTFDTFVVGSSNRLAHAASLAVAENPARAYNPLFLYGGVGLGKTHLLHAIGHVGRTRGLQVLYVPAEDFTNRMINAIRTKTTEAFRDRYRTADILLIDDIQFIAGKESTQEEFFHTFNALHSQEKQLVLSSDRPPKAMVTLEERLRSRFEWGLIADIQPPDLETRIAILRTKAQGSQTFVPDAVLERLARQVQSNIRELEGALNRILAWSRLTGQPVTAGLAESAMADLLPQRPKRTIDQIIQAVADYYGIGLEELKGPSRHQRLAVPRQVAMYLAREQGSASLPQIGMALGNRDHTTVLYGCEKIADLVERDNELRRTVLSIRERLYNT